MSWKRSVMESAVWCASLFGPSKNVAAPESIFVLRNNDLGDLLVVTPLFEALRRRFPAAKIIAGVGDWSRPVLENNPYVTEIMSINAPWHNKTIPNQAPLRSLRYIYGSEEVRQLTARKCDVGIDILGSPFGSLLLLRAGIPLRLGVRGYAGGHTGVQQFVEFNPNEHVGRSALRFSELLGATDLPVNRPQIFLTKEERRTGEEQWSRLFSGARGCRVVVSPSGGFREKCWPVERFAQLAGTLAAESHCQIAVVGGKEDATIGAQVAAAQPQIKNLAGQTALRETFALVAAADLVICNSSMLMHVAAAFEKASLVLLGEWFVSADLQAAQWGYPGPCRIIGREKKHPQIAQVEEAIDVARELLKSSIAGEQNQKD